MNAWKLVLLVAACAALGGCRTDPNIAILERELRLQEDELFRLQDCLAMQENEMASCRRENAGLRHRLECEPARSFDYPAPANKTQRDPPASQPVQPTPEPIPSIEVPSGVSAEPSKSRGPAFGQQREIVDGTSHNVEEIALNGMLTGGYKQRNEPGHDGVMIVVEPRDAEGRIVTAPADMSIVVVDPAIEGEAGRLARWDFAAEETGPLFRKSGLGRGLQIELPWPGEPPQHRDLHLFVRYTTADGRKLQADKPIKIELAGDPLPPQPPAGPATERAAAMPVARMAEPAGRIASNADLPEPPGAAESPDAPSPYVAPKPKVNRPAWSPHRR